MIYFIKLIITVLLLFSLQSYAQQIEIDSDYLKEKRNVEIYLPESYEISKVNYPVIYVFDGSVLFDFVVGLCKYNFDVYPEAIIVGVHQIDRSSELVNLGKESRHNLFSLFFNEELKKHMKENYRTNNLNVLMGHSFGGNFVLNEFFKSKNNCVISISPSFGKENYKLFSKRIKSVEKYQSVYLGYGSYDYEEIISVSKNLIIDLKIVNSKLEEFQNEDHNSAVLIGFRKGLDFISESWVLNFPEDYWEELEKNKNPDIFYQYFDNLTQVFGSKIYPMEEDLNTLGYYFVNEELYLKALDVFKENIKLYPNSSNTYDSLAETYLTLKEYKNAIKFYEKAIETEKNTGNYTYLINNMIDKIKKIKSLDN
jgi:predicted alpha/beta superfamily hydrolase